MPKSEPREPVIWRPNSRPQGLFLAAPVLETLFGGARGPGKTEALLMCYLQFVGRGFGAWWRGILFRQTYKQMEEIMARSRRLFPAIIPGARFARTRMEWLFPDGASLKLRHVRRPEDMEHYQGHEYPFVGFDELCNLAFEEAYTMARAVCRSSHAAVPRLIRATANPLGPGHMWVKRRFIDPAPPLTLIRDATGGKRVFIPARVHDNAHLLKADPDYVRRLESLPAPLRRAWLDGDWNVTAGTFFGDVWSPRHIITPFTVPRHWYCFRAFDWGSVRPFSVGWWAIADGGGSGGGTWPPGAYIRFHEWYGARQDAEGGVVPNEGLRLSSREVARGILMREKSMALSWGLRIHPGPADPAIFSQQDKGSPSIAVSMADEGVTWLRADNARVAGWQQMRDRLSGEDGRPLLYVFSHCTELIRTLPAALRNAVQPDDVDTNGEDHALDETRYACMFRKRSVRIGSSHG